MKENILLVSYNYKASVSPRALKWQKLVSEWSRSCNVYVVCGDAGVRASQGEIVDPRISMLFIKSFLRPFRWPDYAMTWVFRTIFVARKIDVAGVHKMVSSSHPFSSHVIALFIKVRRRDLHWTMDVGDPFYTGSTMKINFWWWGLLNKYIEKKCLTLADRITVNTSTLKESYITEYNIDRKKISIVPPVIDVYPARLRRPSGFRFVYAGRFYADERPLGELLDLFCLIKNQFEGASLDIYGPIDPSYQALIEERNLLDHVCFKGFFNQVDLREFMEDYDYYLNIGNKNIVQSPSKNLDLLTFGIPVLYLQLNHLDPFVKAVRHIGFICPIAKGTTENEIHTVIVRLNKFLERQDFRQQALSLAHRYIEPCLAKNQKQYYA